MKLSYLLQEGTYTSNFSAEDVEIEGICENTEQIKGGELFILRRGKRFDPALLLAKIEKSGISAILSEEGHTLPFPPTAPCFFVKDIQRASAEIWAVYYGHPQKDLTVVAVTGTNGKTTTAHILTHVLNASGKRTGYIGTLGVFDGESFCPTLHEGNLTTPTPQHLFRALAALKAKGCTHAVMEVSSHALAQKRVHPIRFALSLFTNLSEDHLDYHKTMEAYFETKKRLFEQSSFAIVNVDDAYGERLFSEIKIPKQSLGILQSAYHSLSDLNETDVRGTNYTYLSKDISFPVFYPLFGSFNLYNTLFATAAALHLGVDADALTGALASLAPIPGRMERLSLSRFGIPFSVIIDYAHTPDAMEQCIRSARKFTPKRVIVLFGAGGEREKEKRSLMGHIAEKYADFVFVTSDNSRSENTLSIIKDILSGMEKEEKRRVISSRKKAIEAALSFAKAGDTVLLLGKGHEEYIIGRDGEMPFSERQIVTDFLTKTGACYGI